MIEMERRRFLGGLVGLVAAPAIVKVTSLMPIKAVPRHAYWKMYYNVEYQDIENEVIEFLTESNKIFDDLTLDRVYAATARTSLPYSAWRVLDASSLSEEQQLSVLGMLAPSDRT